ncbi:MAG: DUF4157 domain-containing protein [Deltaproteobacteria bacterium]|nr:DUF4157 domain-containing protein [Deltaproteobacteria bacterium]
MRSKSLARAHRDSFENQDQSLIASQTETLYRSTDDEAFASRGSIDEAYESTDLDAFFLSTLSLNPVDLIVSDPVDPQEREAERRADELIARVRPAHQLASAASGDDDPQPTDSGIPTAPSSDSPASAGGLPTLSSFQNQDVRAGLEAELGVDPGSVNYHHDARAAHAAKALNAKAFTVGNDVVFGQGFYAPGTPSGDKLIAHELSHVGQNKQGGRGENGGAPIASRDLLPDLFGPEKTDRELIDEAIDNWDPDIVDEIEDYGKATPAEKIDLIWIVLSRRWVGPLDERIIKNIWRTWKGDDLLDVAEKNIKAWRSSYEHGAEVDEFEEIVELKKKFEKDVKNFAKANLDSNKDLGNQALAQIGIDENGVAAELTPEQRARLEKIQDAALQVAALKKSQELMGRIQVGWNSYSDKEGWVYWRSANFRSGNPPERSLDGLDRSPSASSKSHEEVQKAWDAAEAAINLFADQYPIIYGVLKEGDVATLADSSVAKARSLIGETMKKVFESIADTKEAVDTDDIDYRSLKPIHDLMRAGTPAPNGSGLDWKAALNTWVIDDELEDYDTEEMWKSIGLGVAGVGLAVASVLTGGTAAIVFGIAGAAIGAFEAGMAWENYMDLASADDAALNDKYRLVTEGQVDAALLEAAIATAFAVVDVIGIGSEAGALIKTAKVATKKTVSEVVEAGAKTAVKKGAKEAGGETSEQLTKEGLGKAAAQTGEEALEETGKKAAPEAAGEALEETGKKAAPEAGEEAAEEVVEEAVDEAVKKKGKDVAADLGYPEAEPGYHWSLDKDGDLIYKRNPPKKGEKPRERHWYNEKSGKFEKLDLGVVEAKYKGGKEKITFTDEERAALDELFQKREAARAKRDDLIKLKEADPEGFSEELALELKKARGEVIKASENLGEQSADLFMKQRYGVSKAAYEGTGSGVFDRVYKVKGAGPDGDDLWVVVEAKGGAGQLGTRKAVSEGKNVVAQQGTEPYLKSIIESMSKKGGEAAETAEQLKAAMKNDALKYLEVRAPIGTKQGQQVIKPSEVSEFDI